MRSITVVFSILACQCTLALASLAEHQLPPSVPKKELQNDAKLRSYYEAHLAEFQEEEAVRLRAFAIARDAGETDYNLIRRVKALYTEASKKRQVGNLKGYNVIQEWGWVTQRELRRGVYELVQKMDVGSSSDPIVTSEAATLLVLVDRRKARVKTFEEVKTLIERRLGEPIKFDGPRL